MNIGFTGSREGLDVHQKNKIVRYLEKVNIKEIHHGDCIGSDYDFHNLFNEDSTLFHSSIKIVVHPPANSKCRAYATSSFSTILEPKPYLKRNHDIVDSCDILIACPKTSQEELRSGTWSTIRYARKKNKDIFIFSKN